MLYYLWATAFSANLGFSSLNLFCFYFLLGGWVEWVREGHRRCQDIRAPRGAHAGRGRRSWPPWAVPVLHSPYGGGLLVPLARRWRVLFAQTRAPVHARNHLFTIPCGPAMQMYINSTSIEKFINRYTKPPQIHWINNNMYLNQCE